MGWRRGPAGKARDSPLPSAGQFVILVIDSTDRDRLLTTREELYKMLAHEVRLPRLGEGPGETSCGTSAYSLSLSELCS